MVPNEPR